MAGVCFDVEGSGGESTVTATGVAMGAGSGAGAGSGSACGYYNYVLVTSTHYVLTYMQAQRYVFTTCHARDCVTLVLFN